MHFIFNIIYTQFTGSSVSVSFIILKGPKQNSHRLQAGNSKYLSNIAIVGEQKLKVPTKYSHSRRARN